MPTNAGYVSDSDRNNIGDKNETAQPTNGGQNERSTLSVNLDTYFSDDRVRIPDRVHYFYSLIKMCAQ